MIICSKENEKFKYLKKLKDDKKIRDRDHLFLVEGYNLVNEAKRANRLLEVYTLKKDDIFNSIILSEDLMKKLCDTKTPQGIVGVVRKEEDTSLTDKILYLDHIQDPGNIGTLLRSALAFDFKSIILDNCCDLYNPKVLRSSEGNFFHLSYPRENIDELKELGYCIISTSMNGIFLEDFKTIPKKLVLVLGNEGNGVRDEIKKTADINLSIRMNMTESLNVAVAGSIIMRDLSLKK